MKNSKARLSDLFPLPLLLAIAVGIPTPLPEAKAAEELFPQALLADFQTWTPVLPDNRTFQSAGHGGVTVRAYFNERSEAVYRNQAPFPFPEGSIIAKAVVPSAAVPTSQATRVYFMRKMGAGYDEVNSNWAYGFANRVNGRTVFDPMQGALQGCISCHRAERANDYARTVQIFRQENPAAR